MQSPLAQTSPASQAMSQEPQWASSVVKSTQAPEQSASPAGQMP